MAADEEDISRLYALALNHVSEHRLDDARQVLDRLVERRPGFGPAWTALGVVHRRAGAPSRAAACYARALEIDPGDADAHNNLGNLAREQRNYDAAAGHYRRAIALKPGEAATLSNALYGLGVSLRNTGHVAEGVEFLERAIAARDDFPDAHFSLGCSYLLLGDFARGWPEYEWRTGCVELGLPDVPGPLWDGAPLDGRTLLVHAEQGLGDTIQMLRYLPLVAAKGGTLYLCCERELMPLLQSAPGIARMFASREPIPHYDLRISIMSLPGLFATTESTIPADIPYLTAPAGAGSGLVRALEDGGAGLRVGIVWAGRPSHRNDAERSCRLSDFARLAERPGIALFSLQKPPHDGDLDNTPSICDLGPYLNDFGDTAYALSRLDLVVTVDTSVAHLAGALGRPAWVLLARAPDWRWMLERSDSPWYPSLRLFRQVEPGGWADVMDRVGAALDRMAGKREGSG